MTISFLGQGFEAESISSVGNTLIKLFQEDKFHSFCGISAFASVSAVNIISKCINESNPNFQNHTIIVGVDQEGTPIEALESIIQLNVNSYLFYQKESPIFHPKIYLFEGDNNTALIVGSSNLTGAGLFRNVESSLFVEFRNSDEQGLNLLNELKTYFQSLFDLTDLNLFEISQEIINDFVNKGIVPTKRDWKNKYKKNTSARAPIEGANIVIPDRKTAKIPKVFKGIYKTNPIISELINELEIPKEVELLNNEHFELLWESGLLTERDLNIPSGATTNATGSMLFKKGRAVGIDQRSYFREVIFSSLVWNFDISPSTSHMERAICDFRFVINDLDYGVYRLKLTHNSKTDTLAYIQKNSMTQMSWGEAKRLIADRELIGKTLFLLRNIETAEFIIDIK